MLLAHLLTTHAVPSPAAVALVTGTALLITTALTGDTRWRLGLSAGAAQLAGHALLALAQPPNDPASSLGCLSLVGRGVEIGLRLAIVGEQPSCLRGTVVALPTTTAALAAVLASALIVIGHGLIAVLSAHLVALAHVAVDTLRSFAGLIRPLIGPAGPVVAAPRAVTAAPGTVRRTLPARDQRPVSRRGPPA